MPQCFKMAEVASAKILSQCPFCHSVALSFPSCDFPKVKMWDKLAQEGGMEGQHHWAGVMLEQTDCCSVLACGSSLTSSLFSKNRDRQCSNLCGCSPKQFLRQELKAPAVSLQFSDFCSTLPCLPLGCLVMSVAFLATDLSVYMQSFICLCAFMKRQHRNQHWHMQVMLAVEKSCVHLFAWIFHYAAKVVLTRLR